jgi:hypothetical protein
MRAGGYYYYPIININTMTTPTNILYLTTTIVLKTLASDIEKVKHGVSYSPIYTSWDLEPSIGAKWYHRGHARDLSMQ